MAGHSRIFKSMTVETAKDDTPDPSARIEVLIVDMNGRLRGKQIPLSAEKKVWAGDVRLPQSTQTLDIWGYDNDELNGLSMTIGDPDGKCVADPRTLAPMPWAP